MNREPERIVDLVKTRRIAAMISIGPMMVMAILLARLMRSGLLLGSIR